MIMNFNEMKAKYLEVNCPEGLGLFITPYLPFVQKSMFVNDMITSCIDDGDKNMKVIDYTQKQFCTDIYIARDYANIEFDETDLIDQYDFMKSNGIFDYIVSQINKNDLGGLLHMVDQTLDQEIRVNNSMEGIVSGAIDSLLRKIPETPVIEKMVKSMVKSMKDFKPEKFKKLNEMMDYVKGVDLDDKEDKKIEVVKPEPIVEVVSEPAVETDPIKLAIARVKAME